MAITLVILLLALTLGEVAVERCYGGTWVVTDRSGAGN